MNYLRKYFRINIVYALILLLLFTSFGVRAQQSPQLPPPPPPPPEEKPPRRAVDQEEDRNDVIKVNTNLVLVDVTVLDKSNRFVKGLSQNKFQIFEDQVAQQIQEFSQEQVPISYGIVIDTSGSMRRRLPTVIKAAKELLRLGKRGDEVFIVDMKDSRNIELIEEYTANQEDANDALDNMVAGGGTSLLDGIVTSSEYAAKEGKNRRKAVVVISDGDERDSTFSVEETLDKLREYEVQLYLVGFPEDLSEDSGVFKRSAKKKAVELINKLAQESGGQSYFPRDLSELEGIAKKIGDDLRSQYVLGYYPSNERRDGAFRRIQVKLSENKEQYGVRTRSGYYAPKDANIKPETNNRRNKKS
jgi:Ca-activated chloride channel family protein